MSPRRSLGSQRAVFLAWSTRRSRWESNCHRRRSEQPKLSEKSSSIASKATKSEGRLLTSNYNFAYHLSFSLAGREQIACISAPMLPKGWHIGVNATLRMLFDFDYDLLSECLGNFF